MGVDRQAAFSGRLDGRNQPRFQAVALFVQRLARRVDFVDALVCLLASDFFMV